MSFFSLSPSLNSHRFENCLIFMCTLQSCSLMTAWGLLCYIGRTNERFCSGIPTSRDLSFLNPYAGMMLVLTRNVTVRNESGFVDLSWDWCMFLGTVDISWDCCMFFGLVDASWYDSYLNNNNTPPSYLPLLWRVWGWVILWLTFSPKIWVDGRRRFYMPRLEFIIIPPSVGFWLREESGVYV